jgi:hypothetical protein
MLGGTLKRAVSLAAGLMGLGCAGSLRLAADTSPADPSKTAAACVASDAGFQLSTVRWDDSQRQRLQDLAERQVVIVRVASCGWTVLESCTVGNRYDYRDLPLQRHTSIAGRNGAVSADASGLGSPGVARSASTKEDVAVAGVFELPAVPRAADLRGRCDGATHVVGRLSTGAFRIAKSATSSSSISLPRVFGAHDQSWQDVDHQAGRPEACETREPKGRPHPDCSALIGLDVVPLELTRAPSMPVAVETTCPTGEVLRGSSCAPIDRCAAGDATECNAQCRSGAPSACGALAMLCARGDLFACTASSTTALGGLLQARR